MFYVNKEVDYALQLIFALYRLPENKVLSLKRFSNESNISFLFLQKIARKLKKAEIVNSLKGPKGGYIIAENVGKLTMKDVVEAVSGVYGVADCVKDGKGCYKTGSCDAKIAMSRINKKIIRFMSDLKIEEIIK